MTAITKLDLDLTITGVTGGIASFTLEGKDAEDKKHVKNKEIKIPPGSRDVKIEFDLHDGGFGLDYDKKDPIWVSRAEECPESYSTDPQIFDVLPLQNKLKMMDRNTDEVVLGYKINLTGSSGSVTVDPIIRNEP